MIARRSLGAVCCVCTDDRLLLLLECSHLMAFSLFLFLSLSLVIWSVDWIPRFGAFLCLSASRASRHLLLP